MTTFNVTMQARRDVAADWTSNNPTLSEGEIGFESDTGKIKFGDGSAAWNALGYQGPAVNAQTGTTYTLAFVDGMGVVSMSNASANTLTIPTNASVAFPVGTIICVTQEGAGATSVAGDTGVTLNGVSAGTGALSAQYATCVLRKTATNTWIASGGIGTVA